MPAQSLFAPVRAWVIAAARVIPGVCGVFGSRSLAGTILTPLCCQSMIYTIAAFSSRCRGIGRLPLAAGVEQRPDRSRTHGPRSFGRGENGASHQCWCRRKGAPVRGTEDFAKHWGETGGTLGVKDGEIRVRMGNSQFEPRRRRTTTTGVFCRGYVENKGVNLAPQVGFGSE